MVVASKQSRAFPNSLTDKAFGLEAKRIITGSIPAWGISNCAY